MLPEIESQSEISPSIYKEWKTLYVDTNPFDMAVLPGKGTVPAKYALVGMAPSPNRPKKRANEPFGARSYEVLNSVTTGIPGSTYVTNLVKVPLEIGTRIRKALFTESRRLLLDELAIVAPERILCLGKDAAMALCPGFTSLREDHGTFFYNDEIGAYVVPTYHFSAVGRDPSLKSILARDIQRFVELPDPARPKFSVLNRMLTAQNKDDLEKTPRVYLDIETEGLDPDKDAIISVGWMEEGTDLVKILKDPSKLELISLYERFKAQGAAVVLHNATFDMTFLARKTGTFWDLPIEDTMVMAHVSGEHVLALKHLTTTYTDRPGSRAFGGPADMAYLAEDVLSTYELYKIMDTHLKLIPKSDFIMGLLKSLLPNLIGMRIRGVYLDHTKLGEVLKFYRDAKAEALKGLYKGLLDSGADDASATHMMATVNWNAPQQVVTVLQFLKVRLTERTESGQFTIKETAMLPFAEKVPFVKALLTYKEATKMLTFVEDYNVRTSALHPLLHPRIKITGTRTGRTSCEDPNVQQIPRIGPIKTLFKSRWPGGLIGLVDLSQAELRVGALLSNDPKFAQMVGNEDPHRAIASVVFKTPVEDVTPAQRKKSKGVTFGIFYGGGAAGLAEKAGTSEAEVKKIMADFFGVFPILNKWMEKVKDDGVKDGYVNMVTGRRRDIMPILLKEGVNSAKRKIINTPIQGPASDVALMILNYIANTLRDRGLKSRPGFGVHDSVFIEIYPGETEAVARVVQEGYINVNNSPLAELPLWKSLPLVGEFIVGETWAAVESTNEAYNPLHKFECSTHMVLEEEKKDAPDTNVLQTPKRRTVRASEIISPSHSRK